MAQPGMSYAVVTPARNEGASLPVLAASLDAQRLRAEQWVIVDNGSTDDTLAVAQGLAAERSWLKVIEVPGEAVPTRGGPVAKAFGAGIDALEGAGDVVVKVDGDVTFDPDYFERLLAAFAGDSTLGIAGGSCWELEDGTWVERHVTGDRVRGATRAYRRVCLEQVLPLENRTGWDGIDELKAVSRGWRTQSIRALRFYHHRPEGLRDASSRQRNFEAGRSSWYAGYRPSYLFIRALFNARKNPAALAMLAGYATAALRREPRCADEPARAYIRGEQRLRNVPLRIREALGKRY